MSSFEEFQKQRYNYESARQRGGDIVVCDKCGGEWFKEITVTQYLLNQPSIIGQGLVGRPGLTPFHMLECVTCKAVKEPMIMRSGKDALNKDYDAFLNALDKAQAEPTEEEKKEVKTDEV